ncbi:hypothetical protein [Microbulbifer epialgicus]|uniref:Uncharacterized protein n=1 Tax=Microbulbifer epialgicus TaxID=393907 RepID=A0ABV4P5Q2_9GAMM
MGKLISRSIKHGVSFSVLVEDNAPVLYQTKVKKSLESWLDEAQTILNRAMEVCSTALVTPDKVPGKFHNLLSYYFGLPTDCPREKQIICLNAILSRLNRTQTGLNKGVELADRPQMPVRAKIQTSVLKAAGYKDPTESYAGFVYVDFIEKIPRYLSNTYKMKKAKWWESGTLSSTWGEQLNGGGFMEPFYYPIHLNFKIIWPKGGIYCIVTLIHEATHKFAETVDHEYFKDDGSIVDKLDNEISALAPIYLNIHKDKPSDQVFKIVEQEALKTLRSKDSAARKLIEIGVMNAVDNADSLAWFAYDVAQLPGDLELEKVAVGIMSKRKVHPNLQNQ